MPNPSSTLLVYWLFTALISIFPTRSRIEESSNGLADSLPLLKLLFTIVAFIVFGLENIPKANRHSLTRPNVEKMVQANPSPEPYSNLFSRFTFFWVAPLLNKGKKKTLRMDDIWNLHPKMLSYPVLLSTQARMDADEAIARQKAQQLADKTGAPGKAITVQPHKARLFSVLVYTVGWAYMSAVIPCLMYTAATYVRPVLFSNLIAFMASYTQASKERGLEPEPAWKGYGLMLGVLTSSVLGGLFNAQYQNVCFQCSIRARGVFNSLIYRKALRLSSTNKQEGMGSIVNHMSSDVDNVLKLFMIIHLLWSSIIGVAIALALLYQQVKYAMFASLGVTVGIAILSGFISSKTGTAYKQMAAKNDLRMKLVNELVNHIKSIKLYAWERYFVHQVSEARLKQLNALRWFNIIITIGVALFNVTVPLSSFAALTVYSTVATPDAPLDIQRIFTCITLLNMLGTPVNNITSSINSIISGHVSYVRLRDFFDSEEINAANVERHPDASKFEIAYEVTNGTFGWYSPEAIKAMEAKREKEAKEAKKNANLATKVDPTQDEKMTLDEKSAGGGHETSTMESTASDEKVDESKKGDKATRDTLGPVLRNISFIIKRGSLTAVIGRVGEGKSSLVGALLGEMHKYSGSVRAYGSLAYVAQSAWILNDTVRNNILFGREYKKERYLQVVKACALVPDLKMLVNGDKTLIGEKGINLSGGQKQRISIARAVYANADVYIFDDPLSAVDAHVDRHIFEEAITKILAHKTRILVTNGAIHLKQVNQIIVVKQGRISQDGSYDDLIQDTEGDLHRMIAESKIVVSKEYDDEAEDDQASGADEEVIAEIVEGGQKRPVELTKRTTFRKQKSTKMEEDLDLEEHNEVDAEVKSEGRVDWSVYKYYFHSMGLPVFFLFVFVCLAYLGTSVGTQIWLQIWGNENYKVTPSHSNQYWILAYLAWIFATAFALVLAIVTFFLVLARKASKSLHASMVAPLIRSPMSFFETTSSGKIINRFAHDFATIDVTIPFSLLTIFLNFMVNLMQVGFCIAATSYFLILMVPLCACYYYLGAYYLVSSREIKRLDSAARSPMYAHFGETLNGLVTIRGYGDADRFATRATKLLDQSQQVYYLTNTTQRWLQVMLEILNDVVMAFIALMAVVLRNSAIAGVFAIVLSEISYFTTNVQAVMTSVCNLETTIVSVERVKEYSELPSEALDVIPDSKTDKNWPQQGKLEFQNFSTRYREGLDLVLSNVDLTVRAGERVGVVGRTGAGKSSVTMALFRIIEAAEGKILIDGVDTSTVGLHELRSRLTIIPQDPFLFGGTIRVNLDPFDQHQDADLWAALEAASLKPYISSLPEGLHTVIENGGENMSLGQRQLMNLARAMLNKNTKVLCLDEATAAIDIETDNAIQRALRRSFQGCTVLTIAHRINTIMDSDRILVLERGKVAEYDKPATLLANPNSIFYSLVNSHDKQERK
ncbi:P-loop containing nucleoside triphosphate hydrolase protein [Gamsiella multidivaricata]|uniref:P-loop containing nucleoside triphosphate hydrolase protein n=1 Tax=Gamsiella multidivaricata TaxID=101098 RepID=UPI00221E438E|nr:P-loop containing nucleoside triphosphate hydrolase protein [Gamsiella multidivaricata]KAI7830395.1 P-loop containing nucleoside triphosphate hydrolase protein [Gamsiella multidivaricata]